MLMVLLLSCSKDNLSAEQSDEPKQTTEKTRLSFTIAASSITRAAQGPFDDQGQPAFDAVRSILVVAADKQANIIDHAPMRATSGSGYECSIKLMPSDSTYLYFIANSEKAESLMNGSASPKNITELITSDIFESSSSDSGVTSIVMWQKLGLAGGQTTITEPVQLIRSVARLKIKYNNPYQQVDSISIHGTTQKGLLLGKQSSSDGFTIVDKRTGIGGFTTPDSTYYYYVYPTSDELYITLYIGAEGRPISLGDKVEVNKSYSLEVLYDGPVVSHSTSEGVEYSEEHHAFKSTYASNEITLNVLPGSTAKTDSPLWITLQTPPAARSATYGTTTILLTPNYSKASRSGTVTITNGTRKTLFTITQESYEPSLIRNDGDARVVMGQPTGYAFNIVVLGDGFTREDNVVDGAFDKQVERILGFMFSVEPFRAYKEYFRVHQVYAESQERGADMDASEDKVNTIFNATYNVAGIDRLLVVRNTAKVVAYAAKATSDINMYLVLVNSTKYGGSGGTYITTSVNSASPEIALHEIGHGFGLTDEYVDSYYVSVTGINRDGAATKPNASTTNDLSVIKWKHFIGRAGYESEGAYEGGYYFATGVWRPSNQSIMRDLSHRYFNAISRETIVRKVFSKIYKPFDMDDFYLRDLPPARLRAPLGTPPQRDMPPPTELYFDYATGTYKY